MLSLPHRPAQGSQDGIPSSPSSLGPESYYSTRDIEILHHVVVNAQENLSTLPEGERLATSALFRAYDQVLPMYGLDPEQDHHLSRLIFRIGGERGRESIFDKFKAVLSRMGIELQVEADGETTSIKAFSETSSERHAASSEPERMQLFPSTSRRGEDVPYDQVASAVSVRNKHGLRDPPSDREQYSYALKQFQLSPSSREDVVISGARESSHGQHQRRSPGAAGSTSPRWGVSHPQDVLPVEQNEAPQTYDRSVSPVMESRPFALSKYSPVRPVHDHQQPAAVTITTSPVLPPRRVIQPFINSSATRQTASNALPSDLPLDDFFQEDINHLRRRASRAWGLFQMTKAVSHWHVWTDEKSKRAAVAKRHMARFRHFGQWHSNTVHAKQYSQCLLQSWACKLWVRATGRVFEAQQSAAHQAETLALQDALHGWTTSTRGQFKFPLRAPTPVHLRIQSHEWREHVLNIQQCQQKAEHIAGNILKLTIISSWQRTARLANDARQSHHQVNLKDILSIWGLATKCHDFEAGLHSNRIRAILDHWRSIGHAPLSVQYHTFHDRRGAEISIRRLDGPRALAMIRCRSLMARVLGAWRKDTLNTANAIECAETFSFRTDIQRGLLGWYGIVVEAEERQLWAGRAHRYLTMTTCLHGTRRLARPSWSHTTRTRYARARWKQKHLHARNILSGWRRQTRACTHLQQAAHSREVDLSGHRLILTLHAWQEECQALLTLDWPSHIPSTWLNEWAVSEESLRLLYDEASAAWESSLKTRVYNRWRTLSVQFHSQMYIVTDVLEKNSRKSIRRILLQWHQGTHTASRPFLLHPVPSSQATTSRGPASSLWSSQQLGPTTASSLLGLGERSWPERVDEEREGSLTSEGGDNQDLLNTPTRWTGISASLTRLPTTTPLAPLSTPFERELRGRYHGTHRTSVPALPERHSVRGTPRLSTNDARRIAEERRRKRPM